MATKSGTGGPGTLVITVLNSGVAWFASPSWEDTRPASAATEAGTNCV